MKILHIIPSVDPKEGGVVQALKTMIHGLSQKSVHNEVLSLDNSTSLFLNNIDITVHAIGKARGPWRYNKRLISWLITNLSYFDTVILHGLWLYPNYAAIKALKKLKAQNIETPKVFVMPHGMLDPYFQTAPGRRLKALRNKIYWQFIESSVISEAEGILFTSEEEMLLAATTFKPYTPQREYIVGLGVESPFLYQQKMTDAFVESCPGLNNAPYFLFISRIDPKKGVDMLIKAYALAFKALSQDINNLPISGILPKLVIAGPGIDTPYGKSLQKLVAEDRELMQYILFPGMLQGDAKWGAFYGCEAFILPSHQENFGIAVVEALACGKPVLISSQINIWREIHEAGAGYITEDTQKGVSKIFEFWSQSSYKQKMAMGRNALYSYRKYFNVETATAKLLKALIGPHL
jgi:glycosyltransferase involved in cell wall biosynthesis